MDDEMIERCAKAVSNCIDENKFTDHDLYMIGQNVPDLTGIAISKAVIKAMREPTDKMKSIEGVHWNYGCHICGGLTEGWYAMIDAVIND